LNRRLAIAGEAILGLAGLTFAAQGLGLTHGVPSRMNDRPEWVAIGAAMLVLALILFWVTTSRRPV
jgi:hypothetical protein